MIFPHTSRTGLQRSHSCSSLFILLVLFVTVDFGYRTVHVFKEILIAILRLYRFCFCRFEYCSGSTTGQRPRGNFSARLCLYASESTSGDKSTTSKLATHIDPRRVNTRASCSNEGAIVPLVLLLRTKAKIEGPSQGINTVYWYYIEEVS